MKTMKEKVNEALNKVFEKFNKEEVAAVYLTGSCLNNLQTPTSDVDLYVLLHTRKKDLVFGKLRSGQDHGEYDFKYMDTYKFVQMLVKTNPNLLELVFKKPLYCSEQYRPLAEFLYTNKNSVVTLNKRRYFSSSYHMLRNNYNKLKNGTGKVLRNRAGKEVMNFFKAYNQAVAVHKGKDLTPYVRLEGYLQEVLMKDKLVDEYSEKETEYLLLNMESCLSELDELRKEYDEVEMNQEFVDALVELL